MVKITSTITTRVLSEHPFQVTSPYGNNLHKEENATYGRFAFTTTEPGYYVACFRMNSQVPGNKSAAISLQWKIGIDAKDWDSIARKENIEVSVQ